MLGSTFHVWGNAVLDKHPWIWDEFLEMWAPSQIFTEESWGVAFGTHTLTIMFSFPSCLLKLWSTFHEYFYSHSSYTVGQPSQARAMFMRSLRMSKDFPWFPTACWSELCAPTTMPLMAMLAVTTESMFSVLFLLSVCGWSRTITCLPLVSQYESQLFAWAWNACHKWEPSWHKPHTLWQKSTWMAQDWALPSSSLMEPRDTLSK